MYPRAVCNKEEDKVYLGFVYVFLDVAVESVLFAALGHYLLRHHGINIAKVGLVLLGDFSMFYFVAVPSKCVLGGASYVSFICRYIYLHVVLQEL